MPSSDLAAFREKFRSAKHGKLTKYISILPKLCTFKFLLYIAYDGTTKHHFSSAVLLKFDWTVIRWYAGVSIQR